MKWREMKKVKVSAKKLIPINQYIHTKICTLNIHLSHKVLREFNMIRVNKRIGNIIPVLKHKNLLKIYSNIGCNKRLQISG